MASVDWSLAATAVGAAPALQIDVGAVLAQLFDPVFLLAAIGGGMLGAAFGALPAFGFCGFMVIAGQIAEFVGGEEAVGITEAIAFGPAFSPAISFAAGAAATAYAADRGYMDYGFDYHEGKNILEALGLEPDVLAVGGAFGAIGYWIQVASGELLLPWDPIAMGVTLSALVHRVAFGYPLVGTVRGDGVFDMTPFEREEMRPVADGATAAERLAVEPWLPQQYRWSHVTGIGVAGGLLGAFIWVETGLPFLGFGISAATLLFLNLGVEKFPVTHHITLLGSAGAWAFAVEPANAGAAALVVGTVFGVVSALIGEAFQRVFYAHSDTHWDPPAAAITATTFLIVVLYILGFLPGSAYMPALGL